jgi:hypothetical protein
MAWDAGRMRFMFFAGTRCNVKSALYSQSLYNVFQVTLCRVHCRFELWTNSPAPHSINNRRTGFLFTPSLRMCLLTFPPPVREGMFCPLSKVWQIITVGIAGSTGTSSRNLPSLFDFDCLRFGGDRLDLRIQIDYEHLSSALFYQEQFS